MPWNPTPTPTLRISSHTHPTPEGRARGVDLPCAAPPAHDRGVHPITTNNAHMNKHAHPHARTHTSPTSLLLSFYSSLSGFGFRYLSVYHHQLLSHCVLLSALGLRLRTPFDFDYLFHGDVGECNATDARTHELSRSRDPDILSTCWNSWVATLTLKSPGPYCTEAPSSSNSRLVVHCAQTQLIS
ncbi:hypothetical protein FIBSPDRAFT_68345 [Athelia psychrophila]|uniref:Uncharacterized protein n=1 Tax=Athelia psychrophila TaxID=1759441 RepID=A0A166EQI1_9AGAM|nr:hypothetical protein FIBSPDRAFT_68345 [Fibularhizoctonia sp. CBS 109695]